MPGRFTPDEIAHASAKLAAGVESEALADGSLRLLGPPLRRSAVGRFLARAFRLPSRVVVELDRTGRWVVERLDGRNLQQLANELGRELKLSRRESEAAVTVFIRMLLQRRLISLRTPEGTVYGSD